MLRLDASLSRSILRAEAFPFMTLLRLAVGLLRSAFALTVLVGNSRRRQKEVGD